MKVIHGSLGDVFKQAIDAKIPSDAHVHLSWDEGKLNRLVDKRGSVADAPTYSPEEFEAAMDEIGEGTESIPYDPSVTYDREDLYLDHD